jgi:hypothetical protein
MRIFDVSLGISTVHGDLPPPQSSRATQLLRFAESPVVTTLLCCGLYAATSVKAFSLRGRRTQRGAAP